MGLENAGCPAYPPEVREKQVAFKKYLHELGKRHPDVAAIMGAKPIELATIQAQIPANAAILQYLLLPDRLVVFVVRSRGIEVVDTPANVAALRKRVEALTRGIADHGWTNAPAELERVALDLHDALIRPVEERKKLEGVRVLGIAPNGFLHRLPFAALVDDAGRFLVDRYFLFHVNSTSMLGVALDRAEGGRAARRKLLAFANPDGTLSRADDEIKAISRLFAEKTVYRGPAARKAALREVAGYTNLHFVAHGILDPSDSTRNHLVLADGNVTVEEIWGLPLRGVALTTLSACSTGLGDIAAGDEIVSVENAFVFAGSSAMVATLWNVPETTTADVVAAFCANMMATPPLSKAEALALAQREVKKQHPDPYFWAGFTLRGTWR